MPGGPFLIGGDFNARSILWGSSITDKRGEYMCQWASALDVHLLNEPGVCTCIRPQGSSVVDLSWASAGILGSVREWSVFETAESLSDHLYIGIAVAGSNVTREVIVHNTRWNFAKLDPDLFISAIDWLAGAGDLPVDSRDPEAFASWIVDIVSQACRPRRHRESSM